MKRLLPLHELAVNFGLVSERYDCKRGPKPFFSPEGKVALMFLKKYTQLSAPKLLEQFNVCYVSATWHPSSENEVP